MDDETKALVERLEADIREWAGDDALRREAIDTIRRLTAERDRALNVLGWISAEGCEHSARLANAVLDRPYAPAIREK